MPSIHKSALVNFSPIQMQKLVEDIASYPEFLPWCSASHIISQDGNTTDAQLQISKSGFNRTFTTRNIASDNKLLMTLLEGPFSSLSGEWNFISLSDTSCKISLDLTFSMPGTLANIAFGRAFNQICNTMVRSFTQRAVQVYDAQ